MQFWESWSKAMVVGVCRFELRLPESFSLKDKRRVVKSLLDRLHQRFNLSAAEVGHQEHHKLAELAVACVATDSTHANQILQAAMAFVEADGRAELTVLETEIL